MKDSPLAILFIENKVESTINTSEAVAQFAMLKARKVPF